MIGTSSAEPPAMPFFTGTTTMPAMDAERSRKASGMQDVTWHSCGSHRPGDATVEFALQSACGAALRFRIGKESARQLHASLGEALYGQALPLAEAVAAVDLSSEVDRFTSSLSAGITAGAAATLRPAQSPASSSDGGSQSC